MREQKFQIQPEALADPVRGLLLNIHEIVAANIPRPSPVRLPHATIMPRIEFGFFTFVAQDHSQAAILPVARLYYSEVISEIGSKVEHQIRLQSADWESSELSHAKCLTR